MPCATHCFKHCTNTTLFNAHYSLRIFVEFQLGDVGKPSLLVSDMIIPEQIFPDRVNASEGLDQSVCLACYQKASNRPGCYTKWPNIFSETGNS